MKHIKFIIAMALAVPLASCELTPFEAGGTAAAPEETVVEEESSLYTEDTDADGETFVFETNDTRYLNEAGYTLWTTRYVNESDAFEPIRVTLCKESGRSEAGFGIVFCSQEIDGKPFLLTVLINTNGLYTVGKVVDGVFSYMKSGWNNSNYINNGYGIRNDLAISHDVENNNFILEINDYEITDFTVPDGVSFRGSRWGFAVVISNSEDFPRSSVKVSFER
jgi:hypothetical protein